MKNITSKIRELRVFSKKNFDARRWLPCAQKRTAILMKLVKTVKLSSKGINQTALLNISPMQKYRSVLVEQAEIETTNRGFRVRNNEKVVTYELKKKALSFFYPKQEVLADGIHTLPFNIQTFHISLIAFRVNFTLKIFSIDSVFNQKGFIDVNFFSCSRSFLLRLLFLIRKILIV